MFNYYSFQINHVLTCQCATAGIMFVFKTIMPLLNISEFFIGSKEKMDLGWACIRLIYVITVLKVDGEKDSSFTSIKKVLDLCLSHSPTSIASLMILNLATIGKVVLI